MDDVNDSGRTADDTMPDSPEMLKERMRQIFEEIGAVLGDVSKAKLILNDLAGLIGEMMAQVERFTLLSCMVKETDTRVSILEDYIITIRQSLKEIVGRVE